MSNPVQLLQETSTSSILSAIDGKSPFTDRALFSDYTAVGSLTRNISSWAYDFAGVTGIVAWNSRTQGTPSGTAIGGAAVTKRHVVYSKHASYQTGNTVYFVTKDNTLITREIVAVKNFPLAYGDYGIALLESDLPETIDVVKVLPKDSYRYFNSEYFLNYDTTIWLGVGQPDEVLVLHTNQSELASVKALSRLDFSSFTDPDPNNYTSAGYSTFNVQTSTDSLAKLWNYNMVPGDSGSPLLMLQDNEVLLLGLFNFVAAGPFISSPRNYNDINRLITDVDTDYAAGGGFAASGYTLTDYNLNNYYNYNPVPYTSPALAALPLSATSLAVFEDGVSPSYDITWSFNYEVKNWNAGDELGFTMFLQNATVPLTGGGVGDDLGYSGGASGDIRARGLIGGVLGVGFDTHGVYALEKTYEDTTTRTGIPLSGRKLNSISVRGDEASGYSYQDSNVLIDAFDILSDGIKTLRGRLGNYGKTIYVDYKGATDSDFTNILTKDITNLTFDTSTLYRPGITVSKPLTGSNSNVEVFLSNFHVEGKTITDVLSSTFENTFTPLSVYSINSTPLGPDIDPPQTEEATRRLPFLGIEPSIGCPNAYCGLSGNSSSNTGTYFPNTILYSLSATIGTVDYQVNNPNDKPIRFILTYDSDTVIDTGYLGSSDYKVGGSQRQTFIDSLDSYTTSQPSTVNAYDGYPVVSTTTSVISSFFKDTDKARGSFEIFNPLSASDWEVFLGCPIREVDCGVDVYFECGLYRVYPAATKVNTKSL